MRQDSFSCSGRTIRAYRQESPRLFLLQFADAQDLLGMDEEAQALSRQADAPFLLAALAVRDWFGELSPWPAAAVFGRQDFSGNGRDPLDCLLNKLMPALKNRYALAGDIPWVLGGYSLAGLFALWCGHETDAFAGIAAASPSVWFPGWMEYAEKHPLRASCVYLSLGDREERARSPVMARVGGNIRQLLQIYQANDACRATLEWNSGGHFQDAPARTARAFAWTMRELCLAGRR